MNQIKRLNKARLMELGGVGVTKAQLVASVEKLHEEFNPKNLEELRTKVELYVPKIEFRPINDTKYKKAIKAKYDIKYLKNNEFEKLKEKYNTELSIKNFDEIIRIARVHNGYITYKKNGEQVIYKINENNIADLKSYLTGIEIEEFSNSDEEFMIEITNNITDVRGYDVVREIENQFVDDDATPRDNPTGGFLLFGHTLPFDFSRYGIFNKEQDTTEYHKNNCLYHALKAGGMSTDKLEALKIEFYQRDISRKNLKKIAERLEIEIYLSNSKDRNTETYGNSKEKYNINLIEGHYHINEPTQYNSFVIKNYELIKDEKNFMNIVGVKKAGGYEKKLNQGINSKRLLELLIAEHSYIINKMDVINTVYHHKIKSRVQSLEYTDNYTKLYQTTGEEEMKKNLNKEIIKSAVPQKKKGVLRVFFDFETVESSTATNVRMINGVENKELIHRPREVTAIYNDTTKYWDGYNCGLEFIKYVMSIVGYEEIHLIAHNAGFDYNFIVAYLPNVEICKIGNRFIYSLTYSKNAKIYVKDSYAFIANPLRDFGRIFKLVINKEEFNHKWIKADNLDENGKFINPWIKVEDTPKGVKLDSEGKFNVAEYSKYYNEIDVKVLKQGYDTFGKWSKELGVNIDKVFTVSSLAKRYAEIKGCYEGCYELSGVPQAFISQAVMGGRVMTQENQKIKLDDEKVKVATLDANSLYPSAMIKIKGFIKGRPKIIYPADLNMEFLDKQDYYYVDIEILKVNKFLKMPLLAERLKSSINYTNDMEGKTITVGKIYLEDLIKFQQIEFKLIRGYYFNDGFNTKIVETINHLYDTRNRLKKEKNPAEAIYKLIMNSIYGKCLQKPRDKKLTVKYNKKEMDKYIYRNRTNVECAEKMAGCDKWIIREYKEIHQDFNYVHIGGYILETSKNIMNEVIVLAEDNNLPIYYTDTDSTFLNADDVDKLSKLYKEVYNKELINNKLLGFKQDLGQDKNGNELYGKRCIFLGKKTYVVELNDFNDEGKDIKVRAKGITNRAIKYEADRKQKTIYDIYKDRYNDEKQIFDLTCGGEAFTAKQKSNYTFVSLNNFTRSF